MNIASHTYLFLGNYEEIWSSTRICSGSIVVHLNTCRLNIVLWCHLNMFLYPQLMGCLTQSLDYITQNFLQIEYYPPDLMLFPLPDMSVLLLQKTRLILSKSVHAFLQLSRPFSLSSVSLGRSGRVHICASVYFN